ncbi:MAG TPA: alpha/beta hydrolase [Burkholderiales bacterium]|nr:alpha/beta hydrolase [Burkholderiales bacterium]
MESGVFAAILKVALGVAIGLPLVVYLLQDRLMFYPQPLSQARRAQVAQRFPAVEEVALRAEDGTRVHAWQVRAAPGSPLVLYFGGNAEEVSWMLEVIGDPRAGATPGVSWLLLDYRGYGASEGAPSEKVLVADARMLFDHARGLGEEAADARPIFAFGRSLGSGVAVALAASRPLSGVMLVAPFDSAVAVAKHYYPYLPVDWMLRHRFESIVHAPRLRVPLLCAIPERDEVIPPIHGERLYAAWGGPKQRLLLPGAMHNDGDGPDLWKAVRQFLRQWGQTPVDNSGRQSEK